MNFENWYKIFRGDPTANYNSHPNSGELKIGWDACKKECLEILRKEKMPIYDTELRHEVENVIHIDAIKEIEKL